MTAPTRPISHTTWLGRPVGPAPEPRRPHLPAGYADEGLLGLGGMGEVRLARDHGLDRQVALKLLRSDLVGDAEALARFEAESAVMARLDHPAIVAVHARGRLPDGRPWYAMRVVRGETLAGCLLDGDRGFRTLLGQVAVVCRALAYAHAEGVVHCDLKPENLLVGPFGEVQVLDWGIARAPGQQQAPGVGTPGFLAPEQREGAPVQPATDVFALGRIVAHLMGARRVEDPELQRQVGAATRSQPPERPTASELADALQAWLTGELARERARERMAEADSLNLRLVGLQERADSLERQARDHLDTLPADAGPEAKSEGWRALDDASALQIEVATTRASWLRTVHAALEAWPALAEAHEALARHHHAACHRARAASDRLGEAEHRQLVELHDRGEFADWLRGTATLDLDSAPSGARVRVASMTTRLRRREPGNWVELGRTPLVGAEVPAGDVLLALDHPGRASVRLPLRLEPGVPADLSPPGAEAPPGVALPEQSAVGEDCHVPAGWFQSGGDPEAADGLSARRLWLPSFVIQRQPVSNRDWLEFLDHLLECGDPEAFWEHAPAMATDLGGLKHGVELVEGRARLTGQSNEIDWELDGPVSLVTWRSATAYAAWRAERDGLPWRLPHDQEWEKAARGADGRVFPWGDHFEVAWTRMVRSAGSPPRMARVEEHPEDVSVFGVHGCAGNVRVWCRNPYDKGGPPDGTAVDPLSEAGDPTFRMVRGGSWLSEAPFCRLAARFAGLPDRRMNGLGVRLARSLAAPTTR